LLAWLVAVWEDPLRAGKLERGELLIELAIAEGKIPNGSFGTQDDFSRWFFDLRTADWITFDDREAAKVRFSEDMPRSRNDVRLSQHIVVKPHGLNAVKASLTAVSVERVSSDLGSIVHELAAALEDAAKSEQEPTRKKALLGAANTLRSISIEMFTKWIEAKTGI
jgi:hypothetical protein